MKQLLLLLFAIMFSLQSNAQAVANQPGDIFACDDDADGFLAFDFSFQNPIILGSQNPVDFVVSYYSSPNDANSATNPIISFNYVVSGSQTIYARVAEVASSNNYAITSFIVSVLPNPSIIQPTDYEVCDDEIMDGFAIFDLNSKNVEILGGQTEDVTISYYLVLSDAENNINPLTSSFINISNPQTIYARVEDIVTSCFSTTTLELIVQDCSALGVVEMTDKINNSEFSIFPNPTNNLIELNFSKNINKTIKINIYDIQGKSVFAKTKKVIEKALKLNVSELSKGIYFLKVNDGFSEATKKLIVR